jgi:hypothetical protein
MAGAMDSRVDDYIQRGKFAVDGWLRTEAATTLANVAAEQRRLGVAGGTAEIGVHHGKLFILLYLLSQPPEKAVAIDLFDDQEQNVDSSGKGDIAVFLGNLRKHADDGRLVVHKGSSLELKSAELERLAGGKVRLMSVDGGHTEEITANDLAVAEGALAEGGVIILDDVFNEMWPGVVSGVFRFFAGKPGLVPFAICANKTFFCRPSHAEAYRSAVIGGAAGHLTQTFLDQPVAVLHYVEPRLKERVTGSATWQSVRDTAPGRAARWVWNAGRRLRRTVQKREDF